MIIMIKIKKDLLAILLINRAGQGISADPIIMRPDR